jgi:hypothetical protein
MRTSTVVAVAALMAVLLASSALAQKYEDVRDYESGESVYRQEGGEAAAAGEERFAEQRTQFVKPVIKSMESPIPEHLLAQTPEPASARFVEQKKDDAITAESKKAEEKAAELEKEHDEIVRNMHVTSDDDEEMQKDKELADALQSVKDQIVAKANQVKNEKKWVREVTKIIETYVHKTRRVNANIRLTQEQVKILFRKKKQIENMVLQRKLERKLMVANKDLDVLRSAIHNVKNKATAFSKSKDDIRKTIGSIEAQLSVLRGSAVNGTSADKKENKSAFESTQKVF